LGSIKRISGIINFKNVAACAGILIANKLIPVRVVVMAILGYIFIFMSSLIASFYGKFVPTFGEIFLESCDSIGWRQARTSF
jgi:hypothetical protein